MSGCYCDFGGADMPEVYLEKWRTARRPSEKPCCECLEPILPGQRYQHVTGKWDGTWKSFKTCEFCANERREVAEKRGWYGDVVPFGELACAIYCELGIEDGFTPSE